MADRVEMKKNFKDPEDGSVVIGPRNFTTMPLKKGAVGRNITFGGVIPHKAAGFENGKAANRKELEDHWGKIGSWHDGKRFFQRVASQATFNTVKQVYGEDVPLKKRPITAR